MELKTLDKEIITLIEYNPRITYNEIAKKCNSSKDTIKYRLNKLEKEKIILGYTSLIDYKKLGKQSYKLYFRISGSLEQKNELKDFLRNQEKIFSIFESIGNWNLAIAVFANNHHEFNKIENSILENFGNLIMDRKFCTMIDAELYHRDILSNKRSNLIDKYSLWGKMENNDLDELDKGLIKILNSKSRISLVDISSRLNLSIDSIKNRIKRLKTKRILNIYRTSVNYEALGYDHYKLFIYPKNYSDKEERRTISYLKENPYCINIIRTIGPWKLEAEFLVKDSQEIEDLIDNLIGKFNESILDIEAFLIRNEEIFACKNLLLE